MSQFDFIKGLALHAKAFDDCGDVPFSAQMHEYSMRESAIPGDEFYSDAAKLVRGICETTEKFGFDVPSFIWDVYNVEAEALGCTLVKFKDMAPAIDNTAPLVTSESDLIKLKRPDPYTSARMPMVFEILYQVKQQAGMTPLPCYCAPFTLASHVMSFENLLVQIKQNPGFVHRLLTILVDEVLAPYINALFKEFPDAQYADGSDAVASLPFITQDMLEEFALQYLERLQKQTIRPVICDNWWGDSHTDDLDRFWQQKRRATPNYLKVQDPDLYKIGVKPVIDYARDNDLAVVFGVDNNLLQTGFGEEIKKRIHEYMEAIEAVGKGMLYLCSLSAVTPTENVRIAVDAIKTFRQGDRPYAGIRFSGQYTPSENTSISDVRQSVEMVDQDEERSEEDLILDRIFDAVLGQDDQETTANVQYALNKRIDVHAILNDALIAAMDEVGDDFSEGKIFVPEMLMAARAMKAGLVELRPSLSSSGTSTKGRIMLVTIQGDVHDIGKNLVGMMLEGAGYEIIDLGVNKTAEEILTKANDLQPDVVGLSALLTTSMPSMQKTVALFKQGNSRFPVIVGGAPVTQEYADAINADGFGKDAPMAIETVQNLIGATKTQ